VEAGAHIVQFYESDSDLIAAVGRYLADGIGAGEVAVAVATETHRHALERQLLTAGIDLAEARHGGQIVLLDAAAAMAAFVADGHIDGDAFHSVIGGLVRDAAATGRPVRVYGEMVALLWEAGDVLTAIELESLWNDLGESLPFSLYCSYHAASVSGSVHAQARQRLCHLHSHVLEPSPDGGAAVPTLLGTEVAAHFEAEVSAPRAVRHFVIDTLRQWSFGDDLIDDAALVSSELAANAVVHAGSAFSVALRTNGSLVRIEIQDSCPVGPSGLTARRERGLGVVACLALRWGVDPSGIGKVVWAELGESEEGTGPSGDDRIRAT
jgi:hypothetical protein